MKFRIWLFAFSLLGVLVFFLTREVNKPIFQGSEPTAFEIVSGASVSEIARSFQEKGTGVSPFLFKIMWHLQDKPVLKAGDYLLPAGTSLFNLFSILDSGHLNLDLVKVLLSEGMTLKEVASRLVEADVMDQESIQEFFRLAQDAPFLSSLGLGFAPSVEGFLFPDTYLFDRHSSAKKVITHLVDSFWKNIQEIAPQWQSLTGEEFYDKIKLASIVEKEYRLEEEAPLIASVFDNRLKRGMRLESCATLVYILTEIQGARSPQTDMAYLYRN